VSKTWACSDADGRLQPANLRRALAQATTDRADTLSLAAGLRLGCLAERQVRPIMASLLWPGFPIEAAHDPARAVAFAAGPFMLFRRSAYAAIGGHRALAVVVVEDLALARRIKHGDLSGASQNRSVVANDKKNAIAGREFDSWFELEAHLVRWSPEMADLRVHGTRPPGFSAA
jgi:hypothetical protein